MAAVLPDLDPTPMGWQSRSWCLGLHAPLLFRRTEDLAPRPRSGPAGAGAPTGTVVISVISPVSAGSAGPLDVSLSAANVPATARTTDTTTAAASTAGLLPVDIYRTLGLLTCRGACSITSGSS
jgi:hypothetical protein